MSLRRRTEVEENAKVAIDRVDGMQKHVADSVKAADDTLRRPAKTSKRVRLREGEDLLLQSHRSKSEKDGDAAVSD